MTSESLKNPALETDDRIGALQAHLSSSGIDGALIVQKADLFYFSRTVQNGHLFVPARGNPILMVHKNTARAVSEACIDTVVPLNNPKEIPGILKTAGVSMPRVLGLELDVIPANMYLSYQGLFEKAVLTDISPAVRRLRAVKSETEIAMIRRAAQLADQVAQSVPHILREGMTEVELAGKIEAVARKLGHQGIVRMRLWGSELFYGHLMSGPAAAVPSYLSSPTGGRGLSPAVAQGPGFRKIKRHEPVLVDYVFAYNGYLADHARIFSLGRLPDRLHDRHRLMLALSGEIRQAAKPGVPAGDIWEKAVAFVRRNGVEDHFMGADDRRIRFVGHGVGLELDEYPFLADGQAQRLAAGMTLALEPKLVMPDAGVVGVENTLLVTPDGLEPLTRFEEDVIVL